MIVEHHEHEETQEDNKHAHTHRPVLGFKPCHVTSCAKKQTGGQSHPVTPCSPADSPHGEGSLVLILTPVQHL